MVERATNNRRQYMTITYETRGDLCLTKCPILNSRKVESYNCQNCRHHISHTDDEVVCNEKIRPYSHFRYRSEFARKPESGSLHSVASADNCDRSDGNPGDDIRYE